MSPIEQSKMKIRGFDNEEKQTMEVIYLPIGLDPKTSNNPYYIMKGFFPYNFHLGRSWIHSTESILSNLHRCTKFEHNSIIYKYTTNEETYKYYHANEEFLDECVNFAENDDDI